MADSNLSRIDKLKFPRFAGWVSIQTGKVFWEKVWMVLCNGKLMYYSDWRQNFCQVNKILDVRTRRLEAVSRWWRRIQVGELTFQTESEHDKQEWLHCLRSVIEVPSDVKFSIDQCKQMLETKLEQKHYSEVKDRLIGVLTIAKDAGTSRQELEELSVYLKEMGYAPVLCSFYSRLVDKLNITSVTEIMLQEAADRNDVSNGQMLVYILRRLIWRFAFASKMFALEVTRTSYIKLLTSDVFTLIKSPIEEWSDGNYLLLSTLNCLQQCARSPCKRDVFYDAGTFDFLIELRTREITKKVKMSSILTLSHIVKANDLDQLSVDEEFMDYFMSTCKKAISNNDHFVVICNKVPHLTEVREMFDSLCKLCRLQNTKDIVLRKNVASYLDTVSKGKGAVETTLALRLMEMMCTSPGGRRLFQDEAHSDIIRRVRTLQTFDDHEISNLAQKVHDLLKTKEPRYVREIGPESEELYLEAMKRGTVTDRTINVKIVGHAQAGKTTLLRRLMADNIVGIESTEGIDVYVQKFVVDLKTGNWSIQLPDDKQDQSGRRMAMAIHTWDEESREGHKVAETSDREAENKDPVCAIYKMSQEGRPEVLYRREEEITEREVNDQREANAFQDENLQSQPTERCEPLAEQTKQELNERMEEIYEIESLLELPKDFAYISVYDFAGDEIYYATHHAYLSPYAVYIIVLDLSESNADLIAMTARARFWFRSILNYGTFREKSGELMCPPIIFVGTHKDRSEEEKLKYATQHFMNIIDIPLLKGMNRDFIAGSFFVDNTDANDLQFSDLKKAIVEGAKSLRYWNEKVPLKWIACEREITKLRSKEEFVLDATRLKHHLNQTEFGEDDDSLFFEMLRYLHHMGIIMFFPEGCDQIRNKVLVSPHWLMNAFKNVVACKSLPEEFENRKNKELLSTAGMLEGEYLRTSLESLSKSKEMAELLMTYMEELNLIGRLRNKDKFVISGLIGEENLSPLLRVLPDNKVVKSSAICFVFGDNFIPDILFDKVIMACISKWKIVMVNEKYYLKRGKGVFELDGQWKLLVVGQGSMIQIMLFKIIDGDEDIPVHLASEARKYIDVTIRNILESSCLQNIVFEQRIQCEVLSVETVTCVRVNDLFKYKKQACCVGCKNGPHTLTYKHLRHWFTMIPSIPQSVAGAPELDSFEEVFETPPENPDKPYQFDLGILKQKLLDHKFKKTYDSTFTVEQVRILQHRSQSVGHLIYPLHMATCFRVGDCYLLTSFHVIQPIISTQTSEGFEDRVENLGHESISVEFQMDTEKIKFYLKPELPFWDTELDVAILVLRESPYHQPPRCLTLSTASPSDNEMLTLIGFGHPSHNHKTMEFKVKTLAKDSRRIRLAKQYVDENSQEIAVCLQFSGVMRTPVDIKNSYAPVDDDYNFLMDCFMEQGSSGAPALSVQHNPIEPVVMGMVSGGLPNFFWSLLDEHKKLFLGKYRFEYGVTMAALKSRLEFFELYDLMNNIFFPELPLPLL